jgi:hypothetical protein
MLTHYLIGSGCRIRLKLASESSVTQRRSLSPAAARSSTRRTFNLRLSNIL